MTRPDRLITSAMEVIIVCQTDIISVSLFKMNSEEVLLKVGGKIDEKAKGNRLKGWHVVIRSECVFRVNI